MDNPNFGDKSKLKKIPKPIIIQDYLEQQRLKDLQNQAKLTQKCLVYNEFMNKVFIEAQKTPASYFMILIEDAIRSLEEVDRIYGYLE